MRTFTRSPGRYAPPDHPHPQVSSIAPALRERVAKALVNKGVALGALGRSTEAVAVCDEVVARYGEDPAPALREQVAKALYNTGVRLGALGHSTEAIAVYDEVAARYGEDPAPAVREVVARAVSALQEPGPRQEG